LWNKDPGFAQRIRLYAAWLPHLSGGLIQITVAVCRHANICAVVIEARKSSDQAILAAALLDPAIYPDSGERVERLETHISYVFLAGPYAYKVKKAVDLGFLDFTKLSRRHFYCQEELRLNRRLAPAVYLDVIPIAGSYAHPRLGGDGAPIEYAVKMRRFAQENLFDALLARQCLTSAQIDRLADRIAAFHAATAVASPADPHGSLDAIEQPALENFAQIRRSAAVSLNLADVEALEQWTLEQRTALADEFRARKAGGFVRECHGDFHLGNIAMVDDDITIFDCLEFSANLRWIDVMNEVAFLIMDLRDKKRADLAQRFLNRYLEISGDYAGLRVLRFYVVYRAMVRAKVHALRAAQPGMDAEQKAAALREYRSHVALARRQIDIARAAVLITHGLSGSGKTAQTQMLLETCNAVRIRSDLERKRRHGLAALARSGSAVAAGIYAPENTAATYQRLEDLAARIIAAGYIVIADATFLERHQRAAFRALAASAGVPFLILDFAVPVAILRARIAERARSQRDASEADADVLEHQLRAQEPLRPDELSCAVACDALHAPSRDIWLPVLRRLSLEQG
jgi:uncharacterized protein